VSPVVHGSPSSHFVPTGFGTVGEHCPVPGSHVDVEHAVLPLHTFFVPPHTPAVHTSLSVHFIPSSHGV